MFTYSELPETLQGGMKRYVEHGIKAGHFLTAVLSNDLVGAVSYADDTNIHNIPTIVKWLYNEVPQGCWGSSDKVTEWIWKQGLGLTKNEGEKTWA